MHAFDLDCRRLLTKQDLPTAEGNPQTAESCLRRLAPEKCYAFNLIPHRNIARLWDECWPRLHDTQINSPVTSPIETSSSSRTPSLAPCSTMKTKERHRFVSTAHAYTVSAWPQHSSIRQSSASLRPRLPTPSTSPSRRSTNDF